MLTCPNCGKIVKTIYTDHNRPGILNACEHCITHNITSLQEINDDRKSYYESVQNLKGERNEDIP